MRRELKSIQRDQSKLLALGSRPVIVLLSRADLLDKNHLPRSALPLLMRSYAADVTRVHTYTQWSEDFAKSGQSLSTPLRALIKRRHRKTTSNRRRCGFLGIGGFFLHLHARESRRTVVLAELF